MRRPLLNLPLSCGTAILGCPAGAPASPFVKHVPGLDSLNLGLGVPFLRPFCVPDTVAGCVVCIPNRIRHSSGAIEDNLINRTAVDVLEGTYAAFDNRRKKYHKPQ